MPSGPPVLLTACSTAAPTPLLSADSSTSAADMAVAMAMPVPTPATASHAATYRPPELTLVIAPAASPAASRTKPAATATLAPTRRTMRLAGTAPATIPPTRGSSRRPEPMAAVPSTPWKYCGMVNKMPSRHMIGTTDRITPQVNDAEPNRLRSIRGWPPGWRVSRRSQPKKPASNATPAIIRARAPASPQPSWPAWIRP